MLEKTTDKRCKGPMRHIELRQRMNRHLVREYGMTIEDYETMFKRQHGACAICYEPSAPHKKLAVDHCHDTLKARGLLCENCNRGVGMFKNDKLRLANAINYLIYFKEGWNQ
jgi:hypothetical protein